jgi:hypothetical protein
MLSSPDMCERFEPFVVWPFRWKRDTKRLNALADVMWVGMLFTNARASRRLWPSAVRRCVRLAYWLSDGSMVTGLETVVQVAVHARTVTRALLPTRKAFPEGANRVE